MPCLAALHKFSTIGHHNMIQSHLVINLVMQTLKIQGTKGDNYVFHHDQDFWGIESVFELSFGKPICHSMQSTHELCFSHPTANNIYPLC